MRTTINIDAPVLKELKRLQRAEGKSMGRLASGLLAQALAARRKRKSVPELSWVSRPMGAKLDVADKEALSRAMDEAK